MTTLISRLLRPLLNRALTAPILLLLAASAAFAINAPDEEVKVRKLTAEEILEITVNKTWVVDFDNFAPTNTHKTVIWDPSHCFGTDPQCLVFNF